MEDVVFWEMLEEFEAQTSKMDAVPQQPAPKEKSKTFKWKESCVHTDHRKKDVCLVDALRSLGVRVPYVRDGPFWAQADGNAMLREFGSFACILVCVMGMSGRVETDCTRETFTACPYRQNSASRNHAT